MNQDRIKQMAEQAAATHGHTIKATPEIMETLTAFAALVAEDCASFVEPDPEHRMRPHEYLGEREGVDLLDGVAEGIRARYGIDETKAAQ